MRRMKGGLGRDDRSHRGSGGCSPPDSCGEVEAALKGQGIDLAPKAWNVAPAFSPGLLRLHSRPHTFPRFIPGGNWSHKVGKYEFGALRSFLCNSVLIHKMLESSFLCFPNGVCILIFNVLLNKAVCQHRPNLVKKRSCTWKGSLEKALQVIYPALAGFALGLETVNFPPDLPHSRAHPLREGERARSEQVAGMTAIKQMLLVGIG